jgi:hypothetical protein
LPYKDPEKRRAAGREANRRWREANPEKVKAHRAARNARPEVKAAAAAYRATHPDTNTVERHRRNRKANPEKYRAHKRVHYAANAAEIQARAKVKKYGLPVEVIDYCIIKQLNLCAICGEPETTEVYGKVRALAVDHDHETSIVRGFLCAHCNRGLGLFRDNPTALRAAADYLDAHNRHTLYSALITKRLQIPINEKDR